MSSRLQKCWKLEANYYVLVQLGDIGRVAARPSTFTCSVKGKCAWMNENEICHQLKVHPIPLPLRLLRRFFWVTCVPYTLDPTESISCRALPHEMVVSQFACRFLAAKLVLLDPVVETPHRFRPMHSGARYKKYHHRLICVQPPPLSSSFVLLLFAIPLPILLSGPSPSNPNRPSLQNTSPPREARQLKVMTSSPLVRCLCLQSLLWITIWTDCLHLMS